jgi:hypothetical protein
MNNHFSRPTFCQFGGHDSSMPRTGLQLKSCQPPDESIWMVCTKCFRHLERIGDPAIFVLCRWARELSHSEQLPRSLRETPLKHASLIQFIDEILNIRIRKKLGTRFPAFLSDLKSSEKDYFIQTLDQDSTISKIFLPDVEEGAQRLSIGLKMWVGGIAGAKGTRKTHSAAKGEEEYSPEQRRADFEAADNYAKKDEIFHAGVQVATILELIIMKKRNISLEGSKHDSPIWNYVRNDADSKSVNQGDLLVCGDCILNDNI